MLSRNLNRTNQNKNVTEMRQSNDPDKKYELNKLTVPAVSVWIRTSDELPPERQDVLIHTQAGIRVGHLVRDTLSQKLVWDHRDDWLPVWQVSHWMPLPKEPGAKNDD